MTKLVAIVTLDAVHVRLDLEGRRRTYRLKRAQKPGTWERSHDQEALRELVDEDERLEADLEDLEYPLLSLSDSLLDRADGGPR